MSTSEENQHERDIVLECEGLLILPPAGGNHPREEQCTFTGTVTAYFEGNEDGEAECPECGWRITVPALTQHDINED